MPEADRAQLDGSCGFCTGRRRQPAERQCHWQGAIALKYEPILML
jgi:hypothetical protein